MRYTFTLPDVGEGIHEAEIYAFTVAVGDKVKADVKMMSIETDKAVVDLPAPYTGTIVEIIPKVGDTVHVGDALVVIETEDAKGAIVTQVPATSAASPSNNSLHAQVAGAALQAVAGQATVVLQAPVITAPAGQRALATPHTRHLARQLGLDINSITGTGKHGRVTDRDVHAAKDGRALSPLGGAMSAQPATVVSTELAVQDAETRIPLRGLRKKITEVMTHSYTSIPHVTHADEADVTDLFAAIKEHKEYAAECGAKLTPLAFITKAVTLALRKYPNLNASLDIERSEIVQKHYYNIGIAADTEDGLIVPVVRACDHKSTLDIARDIQRLAELARKRAVAPEDLKDGTFTISNIGVIGGVHATPIILPPQVAILAVMKAKPQPVIAGGELNERVVMPLCLSFDHRIIDGAYAARFLAAVITALESPFKLLLDMK